MKSTDGIDNPTDTVDSGDDLAAHAASLFSVAFAADPFYRAVTADFGTDQGLRLRCLVGYFRLAIDEAGAIGQLDQIGGQAFVRWRTSDDDLALKAAKQAKTAALAALPGPVGLSNYHRIIAEMEHSSPPDLGAGDWYLSILAVDPAQQGAGWGRQLMQLRLAQEDRLGQRCFLETCNQRSVPFYQRLGFEPAGSDIDSVKGARYRIMLRPPRVTGNRSL